MNILYYGNCQLFAVKTILNLHGFLEKNIECHLTDLDEVEFTNIIQEQDIIITQNINNEYRNKFYLSTNYVINNCKTNCKIIIFDSCYFNFYYFDLTYKWLNNDVLHEPSDYHYHLMIECYSKEISQDNYIENFVNNIDLKSKDELENLAKTSILELQRRYNENIINYKTRENIFIITTSEYIRNNYKEKLLFYTMNHPTKYVIQYICEEIIKILNLENTIDYDIDILSYPKCILYKCLQKAVNFNINENIPILKDKINVEDITKIYYNSYKDIKDREFFSYN
jgi:hypothetical protein